MWTAADGIERARMRLLQISDKGDRPHQQMAEVAVSRQMFQEILRLIARLRAPPAPA